MPRVLLFEDDDSLASTLIAFFEFEDISTTRCGSFAELKDRSQRERACIIVTDSWASSAGFELSPEQHEQIDELRQMAAGVILTTGAAWASGVCPTFSGRDVVVMPKPYELQKLLNVVHEAWAHRKTPPLITPE